MEAKEEIYGEGDTDTDVDMEMEGGKQTDMPIDTHIETNAKKNEEKDV